MDRYENARPDEIHILIVDDEKSIRDSLYEAMKLSGYRCSVACNGEEALAILEKGPADVAITDISMPLMNGIQLTKIIKEKYDTDVIMMTGFVNDFSYEDIIDIGVSDFIHKPVGLKEIIIRLKRVLRERMILKKSRLAEEQLLLTMENLQKAMAATIQTLALTVETRDPYTAGHQRRVATLADAIATQMGLPKDQTDGVRMAGSIHDIGKISIPAEILSKPAKLSDMEMGLIRLHSQSGYDILKDIDFPWPMARIVLEHHERMDGSGYPNGLTGKDTLIESRILAVADVVEAIASHRPYRPALGIDKALEVITDGSGIHFDRNVVEACNALFNQKGFSFIW
jgi:response regulator RpfG family c-di-GMP phosphodiesterase